ncbi:MAG: molybdopterin molybdotransferase MoeA [Burkholderiales bacterium]|nr:molybdopterin molybdotransferase MoeA [Burkholderiales bacterium]
MLTVEEAKDILLKDIGVVAGTEKVVTLYSTDRILAEDVISDINVPPLDNSQMDGYAVRASDFENGKLEFKVSDRIQAGHVGNKLEEGTVARIFTGAPLPEGADTVIPQEEATAEPDHMVKFEKAPKKGAFVRKAGCDIKKGDVVLKKGDRMHPACMGAAASVGVKELLCYKPIRVSLFFTGDELSMPGEPLVEGGIYNSNRFILRGMLHQLGCEVFDAGNIPDTYESTVEAFKKVSRNSDLILTCGGMSVGEADYIKSAVESIGRLDMWRIAVKPGKPVAKGLVNGIPFIGLPGNPVSGLVTFLIFAQPVILKLSGRSEIEVKGYSLPLAFDWKGDSRREFIRVRRNAEGALENYRTQNSAVLSSCVWADGLADIPANADLKKGDRVTYIPFTGFNL